MLLTQIKEECPCREWTAGRMSDKEEQQEVEKEKERKDGYRTQFPLTQSDTFTWQKHTQ